MARLGEHAAPKLLNLITAYRPSVARQHSGGIGRASTALPLSAEGDLGRVVVGRVAVATPPPVDPGAGLSPYEIRREPYLIEELVVGAAPGGSGASRPSSSADR